MKEPVGELNATVAVVLIVATLSVFFFGVLWPAIRDTNIKNSRCSDAICDKDSIDENGMAECVYTDSDGTEHDLTCVWKG